MLRPNRLKQRVRAGEASLGTWLQSASPAFAEIAALAGLDFVIVDQEHGPAELGDVVAAMRAAACGETTAVVRVPSADPVHLRRLVDAGAQALLVPMVETAEQAAAIVEAVRFPPRGKRGNAFEITRSAAYGLAAGYYESADDGLLVVVQIETAAGVENAAAIAAVDGVDVVFIGPTDLSGSLGLPGQTGAPEVDAAIRRAMAAVRAAGKPLATVPRAGRTIADLAGEGFLMLASGSEIAIYRMAMQALLAEWRDRDGAAATKGGAASSYGLRP